MFDALSYLFDLSSITMYQGCHQDFKLPGKYNK